MKEIALISWSKEGHRESYDRVLGKLLEQYGFQFRLPSRTSKIYFYSMIDDHILHFILKAIRGALTGRRTVGLFFRPRECFATNKLKYLFKRALFMFLCRLPRTQILTIIPFVLNIKFSQIANGWIYDPQLWDLDLLELPDPAEFGDLTAEVAAHAGGRRVVMALGFQNGLKGFDFYAQIWRQSAEIRASYLFVAAGAVSKECSAVANEFLRQGGLLIDRFISDDELLHLYSLSDLIWSCYAPFYDQASGIFGRSFQLGKPTIIRAGSYLSGLAAELRHPVLAIPYDNVPAACYCLIERGGKLSDSPPPREAVSKMRATSVDTLIKAFGIRTEQLING
jgi:hypothetical protein